VHVLVSTVLASPPFLLLFSLRLNASMCDVHEERAQKALIAFEVRRRYECYCVALHPIVRPKQPLPREQPGLPLYSNRSTHRCAMMLSSFGS